MMIFSFRKMVYSVFFLCSLFLQITVFAPKAHSDIVIGSLDVLTNIQFVDSYNRMMNRLEDEESYPQLAPYASKVDLRKYQYGSLVTILGHGGKVLYKPLKDFPFAGMIMNFVTPKMPWLGYISHYSVGRMINILDSLNNLYFENLVLHLSVDGVPYLIGRLKDRHETIAIALSPYLDHVQDFIRFLLAYKSISSIPGAKFLIATSLTSLIKSPCFVIPVTADIVTRLFTNLAVIPLLTDLTSEEADDFYRQEFLPRYEEEVP